MNNNNRTADEAASNNIRTIKNYDHGSYDLLGYGVISYNVIYVKAVRVTSYYD